LVAIDERAMDGHLKFRELKKYSSTVTSLPARPEMAVKKITVKYVPTISKSIKTRQFSTSKGARK